MRETEALAEFVADTALADVDDDGVETAKLAIRDFLGVALFGSAHDVGRTVADYVNATFGAEGATLVGRGTATAPGAALANGAFGHAIDYDDTFESIVIHPTSPVFPAVMAVAESRDRKGRDALRGYLVGVETAYRIGHSTYPAHYEQGWHGTGTIGALGAAAGASSALGLDVNGVEHALGIAASGSSSLKKNFGSMTKPLHAGHAANQGIRAAMLAERGFTADEAILEGKLGYGTVMSPGGGYVPSEITDGLGEVWHIDDIGFKPYPSGVITHAAMDATRRVVEREDLAPDDVREVTVTLDSAAKEMLIHSNPENALQAKFSIEFCVAAVLRERTPGVREFTDEYVASSETRRAIEKVSAAFEPRIFGAEYAGYGARVDLKTATGERYVEAVEHTPGSPNNPLSERRLSKKFFACAETVLDRSTAETVAASVEALEEDGSLELLTETIQCE